MNGAGVRLGVEALHSMFAADRSVVVTLAQANQMALRCPADQVGMVIDAYHVWWDPEVYTEIERAAERILGFHVSGWIVLPDHLAGGAEGRRVIAFRRLQAAVEAAGYRGPIEVEILKPGALGSTSVRGGGAGGGPGEVPGPGHDRARCGM